MKNNDGGEGKGGGGLLTLLRWKGGLNRGFTVTRKKKASPPLSVWVFIAQLVEDCSAIVEAIGSNPVEVPIFFSGLFAIAWIAITTAIIIPSFKGGTLGRGVQFSVP